MRSRDARIVRGLVLLSVTPLLLVACGSSRDRHEATARGEALREGALVRFVNATTLTRPVDVYLDEAKALPDVGKDKATDYNEWLAERHDIELRTAGSAKSVTVDSGILSAGERYTVVGFSKRDATSSVAVFRDNVSQPEAGKARVRLIHVAYGTDALDVFPSGSQDPIMEGVNYKTDISAEVDPGVKSLDIRKEGDDATHLTVADLSLEAGRMYTIVVAGDDHRRLRAIPIENATPLREGYLTK